MATSVAIVGRFQPFHWGHYDYLMASSKISNKLIICITNPDRNNFYIHETNLVRSLPDSNPFSFEERCLMIRRTMDFLSPHVEYTFKQCKLGKPTFLYDSIDCNTDICLTVYDEWGKYRVKLFKQAGYIVKILWERKIKITTSTEIRRRIREGLDWKHLVPTGTSETINEILITRQI